ncbi:MAG TPA: mechanosensitive ion channel family protein [Candidatus Limivicinus faecipullorum]|nr:mechanosensitive ion channel family protein [Candidatus Limivicinus faecipullorum]
MSIEELAASSVVIRVVADVTEEDYFIGRRILNREMKLLLDSKGIEIPFSQVVVHQAEAQEHK